MTPTQPPIKLPEHSPLPWSFGAVMPGEPDQINGTRTIEAPYDGETQTIAFVHPSTTGEGSTKIDAEERDANARLIVRACNSHEALVAACKRALVAWEIGRDLRWKMHGLPIPENEKTPEWVTNAKAALALAQKEGQ